MLPFDEIYDALLYFNLNSRNDQLHFKAFFARFLFESVSDASHYFVTITQPDFTRISHSMNSSGPGMVQPKGANIELVNRLFPIC